MDGRNKNSIVYYIFFPYVHKTVHIVDIFQLDPCNVSTKQHAPIRGLLKYNIQLEEVKIWFFVNNLKNTKDRRIVTIKVGYKYRDCESFKPNCMTLGATILEIPTFTVSVQVTICDICYIFKVPVHMGFWLGLANKYQSSATNGPENPKSCAHKQSGDIFEIAEISHKGGWL